MFEFFTQKWKKPPLIIYPHGLGDCLMLTPAIREYYLKYGQKVNVMILERFKSSQIFCNNPYIQNIYFCKDPWNDFDTKKTGFQQVKKLGIKIAKENNLSPLFIKHKGSKHKILINCSKLKVKTSYKIDIFINLNDFLEANNFIKKSTNGLPFAFVQSKTGAGASKDLPDDFGRKWIIKHTKIDSIIEVGKSFQFNEFNINTQFAILQKASYICLPESVFYVACSGLNKNIDFIYSGRGPETYNRIRNINTNIYENVYYKIPDLGI